MNTLSKIISITIGKNAKRRKKLMSNPIPKLIEFAPREIRNPL
jgi:hypothetical protein